MSLDVIINKYVVINNSNCAKNVNNSGYNWP